MVRTYELYFLWMKVDWWDTQRWWGYSNPTCCNWIHSNSLHSEVLVIPMSTCAPRTCLHPKNHLVKFHIYFSTIRHNKNWHRKLKTNVPSNHLRNCLICFMFESGILPLLKHACRKQDWPPCWPSRGQQLLHQKCILENVHNIHHFQVQIRLPTLALKPVSLVCRLL